LKICEIYQQTLAFEKLIVGLGEFEFSNAWTFDEAENKVRPPFGNKPGVYIYARGKEVCDSTTFENSNLEVLYVGMSGRNISSRVWKHVGNIKDPVTDKPCSPKFKYHQWKDADYISDDIKTDIANGNVTVYCIKAERQECSKLPRALEAFLLTTHYALGGMLPALNLDF
jgi:hypothetical protein